MRKIVVLTFMTLDGVMEAPGSPENGYELGGWSVPYWDKVLENEMINQMGHPFELLLGRNTYDGFRANWPQIDPESIINSTTKYVVTHKPIPEDTDIWKNSIVLNGDIVEKIQELKNSTGSELQVHGSSNLIQTLLKNDLIDELWLKIYPITLGNGKRLFAEGTIPANFKLIDSKISPKGVIIVNYKRDGEVKTGSTV